VGRGRVSVESVIRGPTTHQFWTPAKRVPGIAHLLGVCHNCGSDVDGDEPECPDCHADFTHHPDRQSLGLMPVRAVPGQPVPVAAEQPRSALRDDPPAPPEPSGALLRHITALEGQVRWVWRLVVLLLAIVGILVAFGLAAVFSGVVRLDPAWGSASDATTGGSDLRGGGGSGGGGGAAESAPMEKTVRGGSDREPRGTPPGASNPAPPASAPTPSDDPGGAAPPSPVGDPAGQSGEPVNPGRRVPASTPPGAAGALAEARTLITRDTEESLNEAVRRLEGVTGEDADSLRRAARARLAQRAMKGVR
jgi:hypothetical protein